ncbi:MAG: isoprenylcysteine carboxylmethyltransferase family protein [Sedimentisphaerales bacterium]|nr:isoprenylcysteine carboxylmethyltransferase family protein [Sedimentisphaerales bacterium]
MTLRKLRINLLRLVFIPIVFVVVFVRPAWSLESFTAFFVEFGGYLFLLAGLTIRIWCIFYIGGRKSKDIITTGPYSICRNPLYVGTFLLSIGVGLCFENLLILVLVPAIVIPVHIITARMEESHLEAKFVQPYREYKQIIPRFWPRFSNYNRPDTIEMNVNSIQRISMDTIAVLFLPKIEDLLELLHQHGIIPVLWHFPS